MMVLMMITMMLGLMMMLLLMVLLLVVVMMMVVTIEVMIMMVTISSTIERAIAASVRFKTTLFDVRRVKPERNTVNLHHLTQSSLKISLILESDKTKASTGSVYIFNYYCCKRTRLFELVSHVVLIG